MNKEIKISNESFMKAWENRKLVGGALKAAHVYPHFSSYEDFFNEGIIIYARMLTEYPDMDGAKLDQLAFRKIIWRTTDELRRIKFAGDRSTCVDDARKLIDHSDSLGLGSDRMLMLKALVSEMSEVEQRIVYDHLLSGMTMVDLARRLDYPVRSLHRIKRKVIACLRAGME